MDTKNLQNYMYQDRAAHLASGQLSVVVALAGKNNIISFYHRTSTSVMSGCILRAAGLGAFSLATILSIRPIRNLAYEFFLICHIVLIA
ncbi:hypothetical protein H0H81_004470 [Sphagnurus paluster]|uniref:Uncharacterized protein n=1 Tax=Sphagnurus paluster TaxID=117069 RepID=A0A9P7K5A4_9AGAR|nr:hypothetical protein H0H81_004470 [Sphagnurus paluster]